MLVYFSGDWDVHWGYRVLTHGDMNICFARVACLEDRDMKIEKAGAACLNPLTSVGAKRGLINRSFTFAWDDHWGEPPKQN